MNPEPASRSARPRVVVFAYHDVGVRGLAILLANAVDVALVVTHDDDPRETIWFDSVAELAALNGIPVIRPADPNTPEVVERVHQCRPQWLFSFYYRHLLGAELLALPKRGAYNLHGSLLPQYRGRAPVNWAVLHGESRTGASLHRMVLEPDAGALVQQQPVPILPNDTAFDVFRKVTVAAEQVLACSLPALFNGTATETPLDLGSGSCFRGRRPEDGRIDWHAGSDTIHNLIRAVAPPFPGAFGDVGGTRLRVLGSYRRGEHATGGEVRLYWDGGRCYLDCTDRRRLHLTRLAVNSRDLDEMRFVAKFDSTQVRIA